MASNDEPTPVDPASQPQTQALATRAVLNNDELLTLIFHEILPWDAFPSDEKEVRAGREQLRRLALCCRAFVEPAVGCLWAVLDSFVPLVKLLPGFDAKTRETYFFERLSDDSPFIRRARRVREFRIKTDPSSASGTVSLSIPAHVYVLLARENESRPLFPALKSVALWGPASDHLKDLHPALPLIFGPTVHTVNFNGSYVSQKAFKEYIMPLAASTLHGLRNLVVNSLGDIDHGSSLNVDALLAMSRLESLDLRLATRHSLTSDQLVQIVRGLPKLRSLTLDVHEHSATPSLPGAWTSTASALGLQLQRLEHLHLVHRQHDQEGNECTCYPHFLNERATELTLADLHLIPHHFTFLQNFVERTLALLPSFSKVKKLNVGGGGFGFHDTSLVILLRALRMLEEFEGTGKCFVRPQCGLKPFLDSAFQNSEDAGPPLKLKSLSLPRRISLDDLVHVSEMAKGLEHLKVEIKPTESIRESAKQALDLARRQQGGGAPSAGAKTSLRTLSIRDVRDKPSISAGDCNALAELVDVLFPELEEIRPFCEVDFTAEYWWDGWVHVEQMRRMRRDLRLHRGY